MSLPSASRLHIVAACPYSETIPHSDRQSESSAFGTTVHAFLERVANAVKAGSSLEKAREIALAGVAEDLPARIACEEIELSDLGFRPENQIAEATYAYNWQSRTARFVGAGLERRYDSLGPHEIPGTFDLVRIDSASFAEVIDYKTGLHWNEMQIRFAALAVARTHGSERVMGRFVFLRPGEPPSEKRFEYDQAALLEIENEIDGILVARQRAEAGGARPNEGPHCRFCPGWLACEAKRRTFGLALEEPLPTLTIDTVSIVYERMRKIEDVVRRVKLALADFATEHGSIPVRPGVRYGPREVERKELDARTVFNVVAQLWGADVAMRAADVETTTQAALERALKALPKSDLAAHAPSLAAAKRLVLEKVDELGGVLVSKRVRVEEHGEMPWGASE